MIEPVSEQMLARTRFKFQLITWLPGAFMLLFLAAGLLMSLLNTATYRLPSEENLWDGSMAAAYQADFEDNIALRPWALETWTWLSYSLFQEGQPGVLIGDAGWLFTSEEFHYHPNEAETIAQRLAYVAEVQTLLAEQGIALAIVLVPAKARIYYRRLGRYHYPSYAQVRYAQLLEAIQALGIIAPDIAEAMQQGKEAQPMFLQTDSHWTPQGAQVAAAALASSLTQAELRLPQERFVREYQASRRYSGDLLRFVPLGRWQKASSLRRDTIPVYQTRRTEARNVGLFDEVTIPVSLVGTSYSADDAWHFAGALQESLQSDVLNMALPARGPFEPMRAYLASDTFSQSPPQLVVWEIPERYFPMAELTPDNAKTNGGNAPQLLP